MPRTYIRKTNRQHWSSDELKRALTSIKQGSSIRKAGRDYNIPESTLRDKLKNVDPVNLVPLGRKATFTPHQEQELVKHIIKLAKLFYGVTPLSLRKIAYDFAVRNGIKNVFNQEKQLAGKDWLYFFLKRNPQISLRQPEGTSLNRISSFNAEEVQLFFSNLETVYSKFHFVANRVYNCDETGITNVPNKCGKIYAARGTKQVGVATSGERGKNVTVMCCMNAAGGFIPPFFIFPRKRMSVTLETGGPLGAEYRCSDNGWMNQDLFADWLTHFNKHAKSSVDDPVLLIFDNHGSHISLDMYEFCKSHYIHVVSLPPHTSHKIQPLDVSFYGPLKMAYYRECDLHLKITAHEKINMHELASLFNKAYVKVATMEKGVAGFRTTGIFPLNGDIFTADDFAPAEEFRNVSFELENINQVEPVATTSAIAQPVNTSALAIPSTPIKSSKIQNSSVVSIEDVAPIPKKGFRKIIKRGTKKQHSQILTSTPLKSQLLEEKEKKKLKAMKISSKNTNVKPKKVEKKPKLKKVESKEDTEESDVDMTDVVDDDDDEQLEDFMNDENERCMYCEEFGRDRELWFRCVICGKWAHQECSGFDSAENFTCDLCRKSVKSDGKRILKF